MQIETVSEVLHGTVSPDRPPFNNKILLLHKSYTYLFDLTPLFPTHVYKTTILSSWFRAPFFVNFVNLLHPLHLPITLLTIYIYVYYPKNF